ncbi:MAG: TRAP transporter small permease [Verrucomicrobiae bacterium]|nr:TRAP transporter small permease [Verrucomicrobiae bacterium]
MSEADENTPFRLRLLRKMAVGDALLARCMEGLCVGLLGLMVLTTTASILTRFVFFHPLNFADPLAKYLMMWCAFLGLGLALRKGEHIAVELLRDRLKGMPALALEYLIDGLIFLFLGAAVYYGLGYARSGLGSHDPFVFGISMAVPYLSVPVGAGVAILQLVLLSGARRAGRWEDAKPSTREQPQ